MAAVVTAIAGNHRLDPDQAVASPGPFRLSSFTKRGSVHEMLGILMPQGTMPLPPCCGAVPNIAHTAEILSS